MMRENAFEQNIFIAIQIVTLAEGNPIDFSNSCFATSHRGRKIMELGEGVRVREDGVVNRIIKKFSPCIALQIHCWSLKILVQS